MNLNDIKYSKKMIAFLDILGFERIVDESTRNPILISRIVNMLAHSKQIAESTLKAKLTVLQVNSNEYMHRTFSDTTVISGPYDSHDDISFLSMWIMFYQYLMWKEERAFVRGAIVYGDVYYNEDFVFGPALIHAYHLERFKALWPRVLIDESLLGKFTETERERGFLEFMRWDDDKLVYLDYLRELFHLFNIAENKRVTKERSHDLGVPTQLFTDHKEVIITQANDSIKAMKGKKQGEGKKLLRKYAQLSKYHNSTISRLRQVIKDLMDNNSFISDLFDDQIKSSNAKKLGLPYQPKYSAEEHPEQSDMLNILGTVIHPLIENPRPDILETLGIVIIGQTEEVELGRVIRSLSREVPQELLKLDKALQESLIDTDKLGLNV